MNLREIQKSIQNQIYVKVSNKMKVGITCVTYGRYSVKKFVNVWGETVHSVQVPCWERGEDTFMKIIVVEKRRINYENISTKSKS